jgi:hypothetical protein
MTVHLMRQALDEYGNLTGDVAPAPTDAPASPGGRARELYDPTPSYFAMDVIAFNGSEWRAVRDNPGPLPGAGWVLGAKGARGRPGERGAAGVHVTALDLVGYTLVLTLSDGATLNANLLPALELFEREKPR